MTKNHKLQIIRQLILPLVGILTKNDSDIEKHKIQKKMKTKLDKEILNTMSKDPGNWKGLFYFNRKASKILKLLLDMKFLYKTSIISNSL